MDFNGIQIGPEIFAEILQGCVQNRDLFTGEQIHAQILKRGDHYCKNEYVETKLLIFYAKCEIFCVAMKLFDRLRRQNVFSWAAMVGLHCTMGCYQNALLGFIEMIQNGVFPDNFVLPNVSKACSALQLIEFGVGVHGYAVKMGFVDCVFVGSNLVDMYAKCGLLSDARKVFNYIPDRNVVAWNSMIVGYVQNGMNEEATEVFYDMRVDGVEPTRVTVASLLTASANLVVVEEGKQGHALAVLVGLEFDSIMGTSLINFYSKLGSIEEVELVFSRMVERDVVTWNLLISAYVRDGQIDKALNASHLMRLANLNFDSVTLSSLLTASANFRDIELGEECHGYCIRNNLGTEIVVASSIVDMYAKCNKIDDARRVFDLTKQRDLILWNTLIAAYADLGMSGEALKLFYEMQLDGVPVNLISWNSIILGFLRNGQIVEAERLFSEMQSTGFQPNVITWTTLISGMAQNGHGEKAVMLYKEMQEVGIQPNTSTIVGLLSACSDTALFPHGKSIHGHITRHLLFSFPSIITSLIDMYAKCGSIILAKKVFELALCKELCIYNAMIYAYALNGQAAKALELFKQMEDEGIEGDEITFTAVLSACNHSGLIDEGLDVFALILHKHQPKLRMEHCGCVISLLSHFGHLDEAFGLLLKLPFGLDAHILGSLLSACKIQGKIEIGEYLCQQLFKLEPENSGNYVALSNAYAAAGMWDKALNLRNLMKEKGLRKNPGCSWIQIGAEVHSFVASDTSHPQTEVIFESLSWLNKAIRQTDYAHIVGNTEISCS
ncbi:hypothetical protein Sjap_019110 [Stephania japonica]|uniref:Chlororespiratory reduction 21 n=1 Tax=Stephania japonica TaxID=461633 RepID=A0AAP0EY60_9MAGN